MPHIGCCGWQSQRQATWGVQACLQRIGIWSFDLIHEERWLDHMVILLFVKKLLMKGKANEEECFHLLVNSSYKCPHYLFWAELNLQAANSVLVSHMNTRNPMTWVVKAASQVCISGNLVTGMGIVYQSQVCGKQACLSVEWIPAALLSPCCASASFSPVSVVNPVHRTHGSLCFPSLSAFVMFCFFDKPFWQMYVGCFYSVDLFCIFPNDQKEWVSIILYICWSITRILLRNAL